MGRGKTDGKAKSERQTRSKRRVKTQMNEYLLKAEREDVKAKKEGILRPTIAILGPGISDQSEVGDTGRNTYMSKGKCNFFLSSSTLCSKDIFTFCTVLVVAGYTVG